MATKMYVNALLAMMKGDIDLDTADVRCIAIDAADYTFDQLHDFLDDVPAPARVSTSAALTGQVCSISGTEARFDANDPVLTGVTGDQFEAVIFYIHDGGADSARRLLCYVDSGTGLPFTPSGGNCTVVLDATGIFALTVT